MRRPIDTRQQAIYEDQLMSSLVDSWDAKESRLAWALLQAVDLATEQANPRATHMSVAAEQGGDLGVQPAPAGPSPSIKAARSTPKKSDRGDTPASTTPKHKQAPRSGSKQQQQAGKLLLGGPCCNCGVTESPQWRRPYKNDIVSCNGCGIYYSRNGHMKKPGADKNVKAEGTEDGEDDTVLEENTTPAQAPRTRTPAPLPAATGGAPIAQRVATPAPPHSTSAATQPTTHTSVAAIAMLLTAIGSAALTRPSAKRPADTVDPAFPADEPPPAKRPALSAPHSATAQVRQGTESPAMPAAPPTGAHSPTPTHSSGGADDSVTTTHARVVYLPHAASTGPASNRPSPANAAAAPHDGLGRPTGRPAPSSILLPVARSLSRSPVPAAAADGASRNHLGSAGTGAAGSTKIRRLGPVNQYPVERGNRPPALKITSTNTILADNEGRHDRGNGRTTTGVRSPRPGDRAAPRAPVNPDAREQHRAAVPEGRRSTGAGNGGGDGGGRAVEGPRSPTGLAQVHQARALAQQEQQHQQQQLDDDHLGKKFVPQPRPVPRRTWVRPIPPHVPGSSASHEAYTKSPE